MHTFKTNMCLLHNIILNIWNYFIFYKLILFSRFWENRKSEFYLYKKESYNLQQITHCLNMC